MLGSQLKHTYTSIGLPTLVRMRLVSLLYTSHVTLRRAAKIKDILCLWHGIAAQRYGAVRHIVNLALVSLQCPPRSANLQPPLCSPLQTSPLVKVMTGPLLALETESLPNSPQLWGWAEGAEEVWWAETLAPPHLLQASLGHRHTSIFQSAASTWSEADQWCDLTSYNKEVT